MQQFNDQNEEGRILTIINMGLKEAENYYKQVRNLEKMLKIQKIKNLKERIKQNKKNPKLYEWILAIKSKDGNVVGKIEVLSMGNNVGFVTISVPNRNYIQEYGVEAIKQFVKICKENKYFSMIELDKNNDIIENYRRIYNRDIIINLG